jgi:hypothetical protein
MNQVMCIVQVILFPLLVVAYFLIAGAKETKWKKWGEVIALTAITLLYLSSQKISTAIFLLTAGIITLFNPNWQKSDRRKMEGINSK